MSEKVTIRTNNVPRNLIYGYELTEKEKKEFSYIEPDDIDSHEFFRYKGNIYNPSEFMRADGMGEVFKGLHGYMSDSYFSGVLIKYVDNYERIIVAQYSS